MRTTEDPDKLEEIQNENKRPNTNKCQTKKWMTTHDESEDPVTPETKLSQWKLLRHNPGKHEWNSRVCQTTLLNLVDKESHHVKIDAGAQTEPLRSKRDFATNELENQRFDRSGQGTNKPDAPATLYRWP